jgi:hypothetical protein
VADPDPGPPEPGDLAVVEMVGLGVDGSASNDASNLIESVRHALMLGRLTYGAEAVSGERVVGAGEAQLVEGEQGEVGLASLYDATDVVAAEAAGRALGRPAPRPARRPGPVRREPRRPGDGGGALAGGGRRAGRGPRPGSPPSSAPPAPAARARARSSGQAAPNSDRAPWSCAARAAPTG